MSATIIPFPERKIHRHPDLIYALECLARIDDMEAGADRIEAAVAGSMRAYWEGELARLGGVPPHLLAKDA